MAPPPDGPWLVVGLGNPGPQYVRNRHNVGQQVVDRLAESVGGRFRPHRSRAELLEGRLPGAGGRPGPRVVLAKPGVFMNESGGPVSNLVRFFDVPLERLLVVHDELDLPLGTVRIKNGGGEGGHNGLRSISTSLGSKQYPRLRLGIGRPPGRMDPADYVLNDPRGTERTEFDLMTAHAVDVAIDVISYGPDTAL